MRKILKGKKKTLNFATIASERISTTVYIYIYICSRSGNKISTYFAVLKLVWSMRKWSWEMGKEDEQTSDVGHRPVESNKRQHL